MKMPTCPLSTLPSRPSHCLCTPDEALPFLANPEGSKTMTPSGAPIARPVVPSRRADEVLEAVPRLVVSVGDRLGGLALEVGDEPGQ